MKKKKSISIIGAGSWGTTLAIVLARQGIKVSLYSLFSSQNVQMSRQRKNQLFLKGVAFPPCLSIPSSEEEALKSEVIVIAIPVKFLRRSLHKIKKRSDFSSKFVLSLSKGIEVSSLERPSQIIKSELNLSSSQIAVLSGPTIAREVLAGIPSAAIIACQNLKEAQELQKVLSHANFRIYLSRDIVGVEIGGALKNIIAIACGIADGLRFGTNTKAALLTRGLAEISRLGIKLGADVSTFFGLSGLGDLATTCFSSYSRNRFVGEQIGKGRDIKKVLSEMKMVAEGVESVRAVYRLSRRMKVDMPITREVYKVLYQRKLPRQAVATLMQRPLKLESIR
ncbi:MAG: NAD(P)-dependent glycerol-3-phosphate dehydrogenase [Candidatus Omnitrophica bacterium]|nr:NAD(P)-dependent glycerol-3-phosphate dehydrogenase [Candidatus Omnitrophota bacterium]